MNEPAVCFVLYSEDSAGDALEVLRHVLRGMLKLVCPDVKMNHVRFEPTLDVEERVSGSLWKTRERSREAQRLRRLLVGKVAVALARGKIVFFHVDADVPWKAGANACENLQVHWPRFCADVIAAGGQGMPMNPEERLVLAMPFHEIESWAFANTIRLRTILTGSADLEALAGWEGALERFDEIADIKDKLSIRDTHNRELVQTGFGFPVEALVAVQKSYAVTVARLGASTVVREGLREAAGRSY